MIDMDPDDVLLAAVMRRLASRNWDGHFSIGTPRLTGLSIDGWIEVSDEERAALERAEAAPVPPPRDPWPQVRVGQIWTSHDGDVDVEVIDVTLTREVLQLGSPDWRALPGPIRWEVEYVNTRPEDFNGWGRTASSLDTFHANFRLKAEVGEA